MPLEQKHSRCFGQVWLSPDRRFWAAQLQLRGSGDTQEVTEHHTPGPGDAEDTQKAIQYQTPGPGDADTGNGVGEVFLGQFVAADPPRFVCITKGKMLTQGVVPGGKLPIRHN